MIFRDFLQKIFSFSSENIIAAFLTKWQKQLIFHKNTFCKGNFYLSFNVHKILTVHLMFYQQNHDGDATAYIAYNDQPPVGPTADSGGHTKGIILTNATGGIWLQHSVPHFPLLDKSKLEFSYPATGIHNGQILHCMSLKLKEVDNIGNILAITKPKVYNYTMPKGLIEILPTLDKILGNHAGGTKGHVSHDQENQMQGPDVNHNLIQVQNAGRTVYSFAKGPSFHEGLSSSPYPAFI
jgi:hypothetical protein